jgi:predicted ATPase/class 3 adenylate cyclase
LQDVTCEKCGFENAADHRYCGQCGNPLESVPAAQGAPERRAGERGAEPVAERRHLTVMFCDLVGSTALSLRLDPEELREVVRAYQAACAEVIERFDGYIAQYLGDGILAYFGYPQAHEDEGGRAASAGLEVVLAVRTLSGRLGAALGIDIAVRVGIHTGIVVIGEVGGGMRREHLALGDAPNIAARLQTLAAPDTVVVSTDTYRLLASRFECEELAERSVKGIPGVGRIYRVVRPVRALPADVNAPGAVGRAEELDLLLEDWAHARNAQGRVVCLTGDPGIGKTNLLAAFEARTRVASCMRLDARCLPYYRNTPFFPFIDLLEREWDCKPDRPALERLDAIAEQLERDGFTPEETVPLFASLLSLPVQPDQVRSVGSPERIRERTREALVQLIVHAASVMPLILTVEDLHWADPSTLEVLDDIVDAAPATRLFVMFTCRPEFGVRWADREHVRWITLARLHEPDVQRLVIDVTKGKQLPHEVMRQIVERTDGVPLFVEELTKMVLESGLLRETEDGGYALAGALPPLAIPATLRDSLEARLDRLSTAKQVAQLGATIGREFSYPLLRALARANDDNLRIALDQLVDAGLVRKSDDAPPTYQFKHALIQEAAYESLLRSTRHMYHQRIARVLVEQFPELAATQPEVLAQHYTAAGLVEDAMEAWKRAGHRALERSANAEAAEHLQQGLSLVQRLPEGGARDGHELDLLVLIGPAFVATRGYGAPAVRETYLRARALARRTGRMDLLIRVLGGLFSYHYVRADHDVAMEVAREMDTLAQEADNADLRLVAAAASGLAHFGRGSLHAAHDALSRVTRAYDVERHGPLAVTYGQDFGVVGFGQSGILLWLIGCADQARVMVRRAVETAEQLDHAHSLALALANLCTVHSYVRDTQTLRLTSDRLHALAEKHGFRYWAVSALIFRAWAAALDDRMEDALVLTRTALDELPSIGIDEPQPFLHPIIIEIYLRFGLVEDGLRISSEWEILQEQKRAPWWCESELYRMRAMLMFMRAPDHPAVETMLTRALESARGRRGMALELRAVTALASVWHHRGRTEDARDLLEDTLDGFTEGHDTPDLIDARRLLDELTTAPVR